jgi:hypothetical protein
MPACAKLLPPYHAWLTSVYNVLVPVFEHPRLTDSVEWVETEGGKPERHVTSKEVPGGGFTFAPAYFQGIDIAILLALVPLTPGLPWRRRARIVLMGLPPLVLIHILGLAMATRAAYADVPLLHPALKPGPAAAWITKTLHSLLMSEVSMAMPFVIWGGLALWERARLGNAPTAPGRAAGERK